MGVYCGMGCCNAATEEQCDFRPRQVTNWHACWNCKRACGVRVRGEDEPLPEPLPIDAAFESRYLSQCCGALVQIKSSRN